MTLVKKRTELPVFGDVMANIFEDRFFTPVKRNFTSNSPSVNLFENETVFTIQLAVPGFNKEQFKIDLKNNRLSVSAAVKAVKEDEQPNYTLREFNYNEFTRHFTLPKNADQSNISASYTDGILEILIAKKEQEKLVTTQIEVK